MILIDPCFRPAPALLVFPPVKPVPKDPVHDLDRDIVDFLSAQSEAVKTWTMVNFVANAQRPRNRAEGRELKKRILARIAPLIRGQFVRRVGRKYLALR